MTKIFAHRGFSGKYPENTMLAFRKAIEAGADGIENDVHLTKDGVPVIFHDERLERTTDGIGYLKDFTFSELRKLNAANTYKEFGVERIPALEEYLELVKDTPIITNIELKTGVFEYENIEEIVYELIMKYGLKDRTLISSFNHYSLQRMKALDASMRCAILEESWLIGAGAYTKMVGVECYHPMYRTMTKNTVAELKAHDVEINVWTVNAREDMENVYKLELDGIITNYPDLAKEIRQSIQG